MSSRKLLLIPAILVLAPVGLALKDAEPNRRFMLA